LGADPPDMLGTILNRQETLSAVVIIEWILESTSSLTGKLAPTWVQKFIVQGHLPVWRYILTNQMEMILIGLRFENIRFDRGLQMLSGNKCIGVPGHFRSVSSPCTEALPRNKMKWTGAFLNLFV